MSVRADERFEDIPCEGVAIRLHRVGDIFAIMEAQVAPLASQPNHRNPCRDKIFEVLEGEIRFTCAGEHFDLRPGTSIIVARGVEHSWCNRSGIQARMLFSFFPDHP